MPQTQHNGTKPNTSHSAAGPPAAHFQSYTLPILDSRSSSNSDFKVRQLVTFPTQKRKMRFVLFLRDFCQARRKGAWAAIPGDYNFAKALEYAAFHRCCVYDLDVKKAPAGNGGRRHVSGGEDSDAFEDSEGEEDVIEGDITTLLRV